MATFTELGIPFPLFEASTEEASDYHGVAACSLCSNARVHCFDLGIGCDIVCTCPKCGGEVGLDADDRADGTCPKCNAAVKFPQIMGDVLACYACLRTGRAAITKDTEMGMIRWQEAAAGLTHGQPVETVPAGVGWTAALLPPEIMWELLRTPTYLTIQGDHWQFCCKQPMVYIGCWVREDFDQHSPTGDGRSLFDQIVQEPVDGLWEDELHDVTGIYVFRCTQCGGRKAHWDLA